MYLYCTNVLLHIWINGALYLLKSNVLSRCFCCKQLNGKPLNHVRTIRLGKTLLLVKLNRLTNIKTCVRSKQLQFIVK